MYQCLSFYVLNIRHFFYLIFLGPRFVDGKALQYFSFNTPAEDCDDHFEDLSPKQRVYGELVQAAVENFLASKDAPQDLRETHLEVVEV